MNQSKRNIGVVLLLLFVIGLGAYIWWSKKASTTDVALVNYRGFMSSPIAKSNTNKKVKYHLLSTEEFNAKKSYDLTFINGMGLKIDDEKRNAIKKYAKKHPLMVVMATNPANSISSVDSVDQKRIIEYMDNGNRKNYESLANYIRKYVDKKTISAPEPAAVVPTENEVFYHLDEDIAIKELSEFEAYMKKIGFYHEGAPKVVIFAALGDPYSGNKAHLDSLITALDAHKINVYPIMSGYGRLSFLEQVQPNAVIYLPHGRLVGGGEKGDQLIEQLKSFHAPLFVPLTMLSSKQVWEDDPMGLFGGFLSQSIVMPELDGGIYPYVINTQEENEDGLIETVADPERVHRFAEIVANTLSLQSKPNSEKKLAIYYLKGPGQEGLAAQGLEVVPSLYNLLSRLKSEGYVINLPDNEKDLERLIMKEGPVLESFTKGTIETYLETGNPTVIKAEVLDAWLKKDLSDQQYKEVVERYGEAPGTYLSFSKNGESFLGLPVVHLGNVVLIPQPIAAIGDDNFAIVHGAKMAPPYPYIASYLWAKEVFEADAMMHFGTHGSLEFTPSKQVALSQNDWADAMVGTTPHFYYYTIGNVGECMMAKRRSYATSLSYLTPPFEESKMRSSFAGFQKHMIEWEKADNDALRNKWALQVKREAVEMGLHRDLRLDSVLSKPYSDEDMHRLADFAEEIANEKVYGSLYVSGQVYTPEQVNTTVMAMSADPIAYSKAALDRLTGQLKEEDYRRQTYVSSHYLQPAKRLVSQVLAGRKIDTALVCQYGGFTKDELLKAVDMNKPRPTGMAAMRAAIERMQKEADKMKSSGEMSKGGRPSGMSKGGRPSGMGQGGHPSCMSKGGHPGGMGQGGHPSGMSKGGHPSGMSKGGHPGGMGQGGHPGGMGQGGHPGGMGQGGHPSGMSKGGHPSGMSKGGHPGGMSKGSAMPSMKMDGSTGASKQHISREEKDKAAAILELANTIFNIDRYRTAIKSSPTAELDAVVNALAGGYIAPSSGGDAVANPRAVPTGRNLYSINAEATPSEGAWEKGKILAQTTLDNYYKAHGEYPQKVSYTFWSSAFIETGGATLAQVFYMLGVEPVRDVMGRVSDVRLIPSEQLGRPRVDVLVQTSGQFRDLAASRLALITKAVRLAAEAGEKEKYHNYVHDGNINIEKSLVDAGMSPKQARDWAGMRVFGGVNGMYGTGIQSMIRAGDKWENRADIAEVYLNNMGAAYGSVEQWGDFAKGLFRAAVEHTDVIVQPRQSNTWGALSLDHVYEFMGGLNLTVATVTGKEPDAVFADYRNRNHMKMQDLKEAIGVESRSTILNPSFVKELTRGGNSSAMRIKEIIENTYGWEVARPEAIDDELWDDIYDMWVADKQNIGTKEFFKRESPAALEQITAVMLETVRKGLWPASADKVEALVKLHDEIVKEFGASGASFAVSNDKLRSFIEQKLPEQDAKAYQKAMNQSLEQSKKSSSDKSIVLKEDKTTKKHSEPSETSSFKSSFLIWGGAILLLLIIAIFMMRRKRS